MVENKLKLLRIVLLLCALYFLVAAVAHFFGLTIFPVYDGALHSPYHDTLLTLCDLIFVMLFLMVAKNPLKNIDTLHVIIAAFALVIIFNIGIIWNIDFIALGSTQKKMQTIVETILSTVMLILIFILRPKNTKR